MAVGGGSVPVVLPGVATAAGNPPEAREDKERPQKRQRAPDWWQAVLISKGIYIQLVLGSPQDE